MAVSNIPRSLLAVALFLLIASLLVPLALPQRPNADLSAVAAFDAAAQARFGRWLPLVAALGLLDVRHAIWPNLGGALLALWALDLLLGSSSPQHSALKTQNSELTLLALGLLVALAGWGWERTRGWWGEFFLTPEAAAPLGPDGQPVLAFEHFDRPPAPDGPGRALAMTIRLDSRRVHISAGAPLHTNGWIIRPHWYGGVVRLTDGTALFFGLDGTQALLVRGEPVTVTLDISSLDATVVPSQPHEVGRFAVVRARYAPGRELRLVGLGIMAIGATLPATRRLPPRSRFFSKLSSQL